MAFVPRTFEEIRDDMIDFTRMQTDLTDFEVGSVIRTIIEAAALEDDEQYFQMVQLLDAFKLSTATGSNLEGRLQEFGIVRLQAASAAGDVVIQHGLLIQSPLQFDANVPATAIQLEDTSKFPTAGFPYTIRIGEGTLGVEDITVTSNTTLTAILGLGSALTADHDAGERVALVDGTADIVLAPGIRPQVPALGTAPAIVYVTVESGTLVNGNYNSTSIQSRAEVPGSAGNITAGRISEFAAAPPFDGATVSNLRNFAGGRDLETDAALRDRGRSQIQSLSRGTVLALQQGVLGVEDTVTGQRVTTANILESFVTDEVIVYIDDGTGFSPDTNALATDALDVAVVVTNPSISVTSVDGFPEDGFVLVSPEDPLQIELMEYSGVNTILNDLTLVDPLGAANAHNIPDEVILVDVVEDNAESGSNFFRLANFPIIRNSARLWIEPPAGVFTLQLAGTDYILNLGTGEIEIIGSGLAAGSRVVATYSYYGALVATVQRVIDGDPADPTNFPGIRAAGVRVVVDTPSIRRITVVTSIAALPGILESDIAPEVQTAIEAYINGLGIGEDVIIAEIVERAMGVAGMFDMVVTLPTGNVTVLEDELPVPTDANGVSLVTVT